MRLFFVVAAAALLAVVVAAVIVVPTALLAEGTARGGGTGARTLAVACRFAFDASRRDFLERGGNLDWCYRTSSCRILLIVVGCLFVSSDFPLLPKTISSPFSTSRSSNRDPITKCLPMLSLFPTELRSSRLRHITSLVQAPNHCKRVSPRRFSPASPTKHESGSRFSLGLPRWLLVIRPAVHDIR